MKKPRRRVHKNYALRNELIAKGHIVPVTALSRHLKAKGFHEAAKTVAERVARSLPLFYR